MASPCIGFEIGLGHICWYFRAYICSKILKVLHPCIGFGIGLGHIWGHANAWIWYIHAYAWILYIHVLSHISHIPKAEIFGFMFQYLSSERMGLRFWANPIHNTWLDHGEISRTRCTPFCPVMLWRVRKGTHFIFRSDWRRLVWMDWRGHVFPHLWRRRNQENQVLQRKSSTGFEEKIKSKMNN